MTSLPSDMMNALKFARLPHCQRGAGPAPEKGLRRIVNGVPGPVVRQLTGLLHKGLESTCVGSLGAGQSTWVGVTRSSAVPGSPAPSRQAMAGLCVGLSAAPGPTHLVPSLFMESDFVKPNSRPLGSGHKYELK